VSRTTIPRVFAMDDLGNRTTVNVRDGNDVNYLVDSLTNRYNTVGDANLSYDSAGNLTADKDGYGYQYDYENRIVEINDVNGTVIAEFTYDALGRRIEKKDLVDSNNTRRYYYNNNWQVLCEYDGAGTFKLWYAYGNYIDEVVMMGNGPVAAFAKFYVHDHLCSPAALVSYTGTVLERYEYDAYGNPYILEPNFAADPDGKSDYGNPYMFTGRRVDFLDNGSLMLQYNRHRPSKHPVSDKTTRMPNA
jgi:YD repeat-containing protein